MSSLPDRVDRLDSRVTGLEGRVVHLETEEQRSRRRLHRLEATERALTLAAEAVGLLAEKANTALEKIDDIAGRAADQAIVRDRQRRADGRRRHWTYWAALMAGFGTVGYTLFAIVNALVN